MHRTSVSGSRVQGLWFYEIIRRVVDVSSLGFRFGGLTLNPKPKVCFRADVSGLRALRPGVYILGLIGFRVYL